MAMAIAMRIAHRDPTLYFATKVKVTQGALLSAQYTHIKRPPNSRCVF
jgi:hypothetical protein